MVKVIVMWLLAMCLSLLGEANAETETPLSYGRFAVVYKEGYQEVVGGVFDKDVMPSVPPRNATAKHAVFVNYTTKELLYYRLTDGVHRAVIGYAVMTPFPHTLPREVVRGKVAQIVEKPTWCPKVGGTVRRDDPSLPKGCMPYGHPYNAMGDWRFDIAWDAPGWELNKLHGVEGYAKGAFWTQETHGCIRLTNEAITHLIALLGSNAVKEGIEVVVFRDNAMFRNYQNLLHLAE